MGENGCINGYEDGGEGEIRTHVGLRPICFQVGGFGKVKRFF
jgi:hypothetical protein